MPKLNWALAREKRDRDNVLVSRTHDAHAGGYLLRVTEDLMGGYSTWTVWRGSALERVAAEEHADPGVAKAKAEACAYDLLCDAVEKLEGAR